MDGEYWARRFELLTDRELNKGDEYYTMLKAQYRRSISKMQRDISYYYQKLADNNETGMVGARKLLSDDELEEFHWSVEEYIKRGRENAVDQRWMKELENASNKFHISRLEAMQTQMRAEVEQLYGRQTKDLQAVLEDIYKDDYYRTAFEVQKGLGVGYQMMKLDKKSVEKAVLKPWTTDDKTFSDRIWRNKETLLNNLQTGLSQAIAQGKNPSVVTDMISQKMGVSLSQAGRLVMTESAFIASSAEKDSFKELGVEEYEILATLDTKTSDICRAMDGKHFPMSQYQIGVTAPPFHPWCRSTTVPFFDDEFTVDEERAMRDPKTGKYATVPSNMKYEDWYKKYVDPDYKGVKLPDLEPTEDEETTDTGMQTLEQLEKDHHDCKFEIEVTDIELANVNTEIVDTRRLLDEYHFAERSYGDVLHASEKDYKQKKSDASQKVVDLQDEWYKTYNDRKPLQDGWNPPTDPDKRAKYDELTARCQQLEHDIRAWEKEVNRLKEANKYRKKFKDKTEEDFITTLDDLKIRKEEIKGRRAKAYDRLDDIERDILKANGEVPETVRDRIKAVKDRIASNGGVVTEADIKEAGSAIKDNLRGSSRQVEIHQIKDRMPIVRTDVESIRREIKGLYGEDGLDKFDHFRWLTRRIERSGSLPLYAQKEYDEILKYIDNLPEDTRKLFDRGFKSAKELSELDRRLEILSNKYDSADDLRFILSKIRDMGCDDIDIMKHLQDSKSVVASDIVEAYRRYPTDWVKASVNKGDLFVKKVKRGYYAWTEIAISGEGDDAFETAIHELGHRMEDTFKTIKDAEKEFYARRTAGEDLKRLGSGYKRDEVTRKDQFVHPYMGKDYGGSSYELVSMGFAYAYTNPLRLMEDDDMTEWILGILSLM